MSKYGQFCPIALAAEVFAERWTPLILRELIYRPMRFAELHRGVPRMSRNLLTQRLVSLEDAGIVDRTPLENARGHLYSLTKAGEELNSVVDSLGHWGYRWSIQNLQEEDLDPGHILWALKRYIILENLPANRVVAKFNFPNLPSQRFWLVLTRPEPDLCLADPGFDLDLDVTVDPLTLSTVCLGKLPMKSAMRSGELRVEGLPKLRRAFPTWFGVTHFAPANK